MLSTEIESSNSIRDQVVYFSLVLLLNGFVQHSSCDQNMLSAAGQATFTLTHDQSPSRAQRDVRKYLVT